MKIGIFLAAARVARTYGLGADRMITAAFLAYRERIEGDDARAALAIVREFGLPTHYATGRATAVN